MGVSKAKEKLYPEEIEAILECNTRLFKNDPYFPKYIVKLAMYLMEYHLQGYGGENGSNFSTGQSFFTPGSLIRSFREDSDFDANERCAFCGALLQGKRKCEKCGQFVI